jgi:hypothetical protein
MCLLLLTAGCKPVKSPGSTQEKEELQVDGNKELYERLDSVNIPDDYRIRQYYDVNSYGAYEQRNISGRFKNNELVELLMTIGPGDRVFSCNTVEECDKYYPKEVEEVEVKTIEWEKGEVTTTLKTKEFSYSWMIFDYPLSMERIINKFKKNHLAGNYSHDFGKVSFHNAICFKPYWSGRFIICFNNQNEIIYYSSSDYRGFYSGSWRLVGHELDNEQIKEIYDAVKKQGKDIITNQLNECEGACKESAYPEFLENLRKPSEPCFKANETTRYWNGTCFETNRLEYIHFCDNKFVECFSTWFDEFREEIKDEFLKGHPIGISSRQYGSVGEDGKVTIKGTKSHDILDSNDLHN